MCQVNVRAKAKYACMNFANWTAAGDSSTFQNDKCDLNRHVFAGPTDPAWSVGPAAWVVGSKLKSLVRWC